VNKNNTWYVILTAVSNVEDSVVCIGPPKVWHHPGCL